MEFAPPPEVNDITNVDYNFLMFCSLDMESDNIEEEESRLVINAVKDANIPKFIAEDIPLFKSILADLFPGMDPPGADNKLLKVSAF